MALPALTIRRPRPAFFDTEAEAVAALLIAARRATMPGLAEPRSEGAIRTWMRSEVFPRRSVLIAQFAEEIVGFAARDGAWLEQLYVKPGWTGHGIGQKLLDAMLTEAALVTPVLRLHAFQRNVGARRFYERNGFVAVAHGDGHDNEEREPDVRYERACGRGTSKSIVD
jgi:GNAT superfamily N-acetyltransferase